MEGDLPRGAASDLKKRGRGSVRPQAGTVAMHWRAGTASSALESPC